jgi:hypothetical protein
VYVDENYDVYAFASNGFELIYPLSEASNVYTKFQLAMQADVFSKHPLSDFEYLDLRFGDKLYYKLK